MRCPNCNKMNFGTRQCEECTEKLDVGVATWKKTLPGWTGDAAIYHLDPPFEWTDLDDDGETVINKSTDYVLISATFAMVGPETIMVEADEDGPVFGDVDANGQPVGLKALAKLVGQMDHRQILPEYEFRMQYLDRADYAE